MTTVNAPSRATCFGMEDCLKFNDIASFMFDSWLAGATETAIMVLGPPGVGKTAICALVAQRMTEHTQARQPSAPPALFAAWDTTSMLPEDLSGLPFRGKIGDVDTTFYAPQAALSAFAQEGAYGVLCLDDIPTSSQAVQCAARKLMLYKSTGDVKLRPEVLVCGTGNRREDKSNAGTLPAHFRNSTLIVEMEVELPDSSGSWPWANWYGQQEGCDPIVASFLRFRIGHFSKLPKDADPELGSYPTPRSWHKLGRLYSVAQKTGTLFDVAAGLVGRGVATEFIAFVNTRAQLVDPARVLRDPQAAVSNPASAFDTPDKLHACVSAVSELAAKWRNSGEVKQRKEVPLQFLRAIGWITRSSREHIGLAIQTYGANGGSVTDLVAAQKANSNDPLVKEVTSFLQRTFNTGGK